MDVGWRRVKENTSLNKHWNITRESAVLTYLRIVNTGVGQH